MGCAALLAWNRQLQHQLRRSRCQLQRSEAGALATLQAIPDLLFELDHQGRYLAVQALNASLLVETQDQLLGRRVDEVLPPAASATCLQALAEAAAHGSSHGHQVLLPLPDGERWFELSVARKPGSAGAEHSFVVLSRDIQARRIASEELDRQIRFYAVLSRCNNAILASHNEAELLQRICQEAISTGVLRMAWIGMVQPGTELVKPLAWAGDGTDYLSNIHISCAADSPYGQGPTGIAIREDRPYWCQDFQHDAATLPWHARGSRYGWLASASLPLHRHGSRVGALTLYASEAHAFTPGVQQLLLDMATDLDLALDRFRREAEEERLRLDVLERERQYRELTETINDVVWRLEAHTLKPLCFSPSVQQVWGYSPEELLAGLPWRACGPHFRRWCDQRNGDVQHWLERARDRSIVSSPLEEMELRHRDGRPIWVENSITLVLRGSSGKPEFHGVSRDITARKLAEQQLEKLAHFDQLTGLANRELLHKEFQFVLSNGLREQQPVAVMLLNLNRFQLINDSLGSEAGDQLLVETARRLRRTLRDSDVIARVSGDEFLIVLPRVQEPEAALLAAALLAAVAEPWSHAGRQVVVTASIGLAMAPGDGRHQELLTRKASLALHEVKQEQPNSYRFFTEELQVRTARILELSNDLRFAIGTGELQLVYQPQVDTHSGRVLGAEALLRWHHPRLGCVSPTEFIPVAEHSDLILSVGSWVMSEAIRQLRQWIDAGAEPPPIAVNLSALQFRQADLAAQTAALLDAAGVPADRLVFELTETATMENQEAAQGTIQQLAQLGIRFAIDDFGTGYSSFSHLRRLHADKLKIDASFIRDLSCSADDRAIVKGIILMARAMGMRTLAEGVETVQQHQFLRAQGCDEIQGYLFSEPLSAPAFLAYLRQQRPPRMTQAMAL